MSKKTLRDMIVLVAIILFCSMAARFLAGGETLSEYAKKNPQKQTSESSASASDSAENENTAGDGSKDTASVGDAIRSENTADAKAGAGSEDSLNTQNKDRVTYMEGFYYEPISNEIFKRISGISYPVDCDVPISDLRYVGLKYIDFNGEEQTGEMICNASIAQDVVEIFSELYRSDYRIESIKLIDEFDGDDTASMLANNTSCFNYRNVPGTKRLSNHALGLAIDVNPFYNPYITYNKDGTKKISPEGSEIYADRNKDFPYKIDESDLAYKLFIQHGFTWGGNWNTSKDYQHFERLQ